jgi:transcriptional regulator with XRE-family HTH domain
MKDASIVLAQRKVNYKEAFMERLAGGRKRKGLTQARLAKEMGVRLRSIQNWECGIAEPRGRELRKLSKILGLSVAFLLGMDEGPPLKRNS